MRRRSQGKDDQGGNRQRETQCFSAVHRFFQTDDGQSGGQNKAELKDGHHHAGLRAEGHRPDNAIEHHRHQKSRQQPVPENRGRGLEPKASPRQEVQDDRSQSEAGRGHHRKRGRLDAVQRGELETERVDPITHKGGDSEGFWRGFLTVYSLLILENRAIVSFGEGERYAGVAEAPVEALLNAEMLALCEH